MTERNVLEFKTVCGEYLFKMSLNTLRSYGRYIHLKKPSKCRKADLINGILGVLCGEIAPQSTNRGAPIKNDYIKPKIIEEIQRLKKEYLGEDTELGEEASAVAEQPVVASKEEKENEKGKEVASVCVKFEIQVSALNEGQKKLLSDFLNSL